MGKLCFELLEYFNVRLCQSCNLKYPGGVGGRRELTGNRLLYEYSRICVAFPPVPFFWRKDNLAWNVLEEVFWQGPLISVETTVTLNTKQEATVRRPEA